MMMMLIKTPRFSLFFSLSLPLSIKKMPLFSKKITPTEITTNIDKATNPSVTELDWSLVFQICDAVNSSEIGAKEARKLLQKKMMSSDPKVQVLGLEVKKKRLLRKYFSHVVLF
jgi:hypothetical protein